MICKCWKRERNKFIKALKKSNLDRAKAAKFLKLSRATFFRRAKELNLVNIRPDFTIKTRWWSD